MDAPRWKSDWSLLEPLEPSADLQDRKLRRFQRLVEHYGLSFDNPNDGWKLAVMLAEEHVRGLQVKRPTGVQANNKSIANDVTLLFGVETVKAKTPREPILKIVKALAKHNGWPADDASLRTLRRRYFELKKPTSPERKRAVAAVREILPDLLLRQSALEKK